MNLSGLHLLLTYKCNFECDHCFVWGSPWQKGTMRSEDIQRILAEAQGAGSVTGIAFEGGEPFLYYATLLVGVTLAAKLGFRTTIVSNTYWAISQADAEASLAPFAGKLAQLTISTDLFHYDEAYSQQARFAQQAAEKFGIATSVIMVARPDEISPEPGAGGVMYRGRAAVKLAGKVPAQDWASFTTCPYENLASPARIHVDALGNLHLCQGIILGNLFQHPLRDICQAYDAAQHPVAGPMVAGGPAELARRYGITPTGGFADACHLCYQVRLQLRETLPGYLGPDQMYGINLT